MDNVNQINFSFAPFLVILSAFKGSWAPACKANFPNLQSLNKIMDLKQLCSCAHNKAQRKNYSATRRKC